MPNTTPAEKSHPVSERLARLEQKKAALEQQIRREKFRQSAQDRKTDTRRKILAGAIVLTHADIDATFHEALYDLLNRFLLPERDRALFGLPPLPATTPMPEPLPLPASKKTHAATRIDRKESKGDGNA